MTESLSTNPQKLVELLSKIEAKVKDVQMEKKPEDHLLGKGQPDTLEDHRSNKRVRIERPWVEEGYSLEKPSTESR